MMKQMLLVLVLAVAHTAAFVPIQPPVEVAVSAQAPMLLQQPSQELQRGVQSFLLDESSTSMTLSLQERRPPTAEEIAAKKRNFNLWFWGGGFVAPFLATFYYFGFKFWEK